MAHAASPARQPAPRPIARLGFLTLPRYTMIAFANALEAARMANYVLDAPAYDWVVASVDGGPAVASNGLQVATQGGLDSLGDLDLVFVCGGIDVRGATDRRLVEGLRRLDRRGVALGGLCTGSFALAKAGLMDGYRCAIHWENLAAIREEFAQTTFVEDIFAIDRDRFTCTGGVAPLELMLALIGRRFGHEAAARVSDQFIVDRPRGPENPQQAPLRHRVAVPHPVLEQAAGIMKTRIENPISVEAVADAAEISPRQLERLFRRHLSQGPAEFYLGLRLERARELLRFTGLPVTDVAMACGFQSPAHFSTAYRKSFGHPPRAERAAQGKACP